MCILNVDLTLRGVRRSDGEGMSGRPPKGILRSSGSAHSADLTSHMISPRTSGNGNELPSGLPLGDGRSMAGSGNTSGQLGSSQLPRSVIILSGSPFHALHPSPALAQKLPWCQLQSIVH